MGIVYVVVMPACVEPAVIEVQFISPGIVTYVNKPAL